MIRPTRCVVLVCDYCATVLSHPDTDAEIHYETAEAARADATADLGWSQVGEWDRCPGCTCATHGHDWPDWPALPPGSHLTPYRWCDRCHALEAWGQGVIGRA